MGAQAPGPLPFDPWTATAAATAAAQAATSDDGPRGPALQWQAACQVTAARPGCAGPNGGTVALSCVNVCAIHGLVMPDWLADEFSRRHALVTTARARTWSDAFGLAWPKGARLKGAPDALALRRRIHSEVMRLALARPELAIGRVLFEEVGEQPGIGLSGAAVERHYFAALHQDGSVNVAQLRRALKASATNPHPDRKILRTNSKHAAATLVAFDPIPKAIEAC